MEDKSIVALVAVVFLTLAGFISAFSLSHVDRYYVASSGTGRVSSVTCSWAHWTAWHPDEIAYCSDDANKVVEWVAKANGSIK